MEIIKDKMRNILLSRMGLGTHVLLIQPHVNVTDIGLMATPNEDSNC